MKEINIMWKFNILFFLALAFCSNGVQAQLVLKNTCNGSTNGVLLTDAINYFRIENWPGKTKMRMDCIGCDLDMKDPAGIFKITPSNNVADTLVVYQEEKEYQRFVLKHEQAKDLHVLIKYGKNKTISRKHITTESELSIRTGQPGCKTDYIITEYDLVFTGGNKTHCRGNKLSAEAVQKLLSLEAGMQFEIKNAVYLQGKSSKQLPIETYFLKD